MQRNELANSINKTKNRARKLIHHLDHFQTRLGEDHTNPILYKLD